MLATREAVPLLANNPIILGRLIQPFKHLALRNPSIISYFIDRVKVVQQFWRRSLVRCIRVVLKHIIYKWQGPALGACSGVRKNITHRKQTEKQKLKMATITPK